MLDIKDLGSEFETMTEQIIRQMVEEYNKQLENLIIKALSKHTYVINDREELKRFAAYNCTVTTYDGIYTLLAEGAPICCWTEQEVKTEFKDGVAKMFNTFNFETL